MRWTTGALALLIIGVGFYFFPLGEDVVFYYLLQWSGGDYWMARAAQYVIFGGLIIMGWTVWKYRTGGFLAPIAVIGCFMLVALMGIGVI
jgi:hypothetical protein